MPTARPRRPTRSTTEKAIAAEAMRGGPRGEPRIFETPEELNELSRGASPKYMNGQFRYYLANVAMMQPQGECKTPLLAVNLAVENLHGMPTVAIYGEFTFTQVVGGDGSAMTETVATPFHANILGPFSNKQGGLVYATAFLEQTDPVARPRPLGEDRRDQPAAAQGLVQARSLLLRRRHAIRAAHRQGRRAARRPHLRRPRRRPLADQVARPRRAAIGASSRPGRPPSPLAAGRRRRRSVASARRTACRLRRLPGHGHPRDAAPVVARLAPPRRAARRPLVDRPRLDAGLRARRRRRAERRHARPVERRRRARSGPRSWPPTSSSA